MEPHFQTLVVNLVPQTRMPPPAYSTKKLQEIFATVGESHPYESFEFVYERRGAKFANEELDFAEVRPAQHQVVVRMDGQDVLTSDLARAKAVQILKTAADELEVPLYLQATIEIIANVPAPDIAHGDAKEFLETKLAAGPEASSLGDGYFASTVKYRREVADAVGEDVFEVEPFFQDTSQIFLRHDMIRMASESLLTIDKVEDWVAGGFEFMNGPAMRFLEKGGS
jgi:hypothetical protein